MTDLLDLHGEENDGSFTMRRLSPTEKWCDRCNCYVERGDAVLWTADGSFTHYLCPGCDAELWEPESNEELYTAVEVAEARSRRTHALKAPAECKCGSKNGKHAAWCN